MFVKTYAGAIVGIDALKVTVEVNLTGGGLGLYLVRLIAMEHGGSVQAASQLGSGSTFTITLPLA